MKVLLTGAKGQLGQALLGSIPCDVELIATTRQELDLADPHSCSSAVQTHQPDWVINAGAYTAVDKAESEPDLALSVNADAARALAKALLDSGGRLLQLSTDFVFNGQQGCPYQPNQTRDPLGVYGFSKSLGEQAVEEVLGCSSTGRATILRTSWVYGPVGKNFFLTMMRLHRLRSQAGEPLAVVADQVGCPTSSVGLATACWAVIQQQAVGIQHWSDAGAASWYDFAVAIGELAVAQGLIPYAAEVVPITTADYATSAKRPAYSLLDCTATRQQLRLKPQHWRRALDQVISNVDS